ARSRLRHLPRGRGSGGPARLDSLRPVVEALRGKDRLLDRRRALARRDGGSRCLPSLYESPGMKPRRSKPPRGPAPPPVRLPLPRKTEKRHGEGKKYDRKKEKETVRKELDDIKT